MFSAAYPSEQSFGKSSGGCRRPLLAVPVAVAIPMPSSGWDQRLHALHRQDDDGQSAQDERHAGTTCWAEDFAEDQPRLDLSAVIARSQRVARTRAR